MIFSSLLGAAATFLYIIYDILYQIVKSSSWVDVCLLGFTTAYAGASVLSVHNSLLFIKMDKFYVKN